MVYDNWYAFVARFTDGREEEYLTYEEAVAALEVAQ